jgi:hypothetical protein
MDFRNIDPTASFSISSSKSRNVYPFAPRVPVQIPGVRVSVSLGTFGYNTSASFDERPAHARFVAWVDAIETEARRFLDENDPGLAWTTSVKGFGAFKTMYLTIDQGTISFDADGSILEESPCKLTCFDAIADIAGIWTSPTNAGLRWKLVQVKKRDPLPFVPSKIAFLDYEEPVEYAVGAKRSYETSETAYVRAPSRAKPTCMFLDDE